MSMILLENSGQMMQIQGLLPWLHTTIVTRSEHEEMHARILVLAQGQTDCLCAHVHIIDNQGSGWITSSNKRKVSFAGWEANYCNGKFLVLSKSTLNV